VGSREYKISRGIKPNIFEIWVDGEVQNQSAAAVDQQKYLEENILKLNYKSFTQIVILGSASFVPFMQLSSSNRRDIVEDLLDIKIFSSMNSVVKDKMKRLNEKFKEESIKETMTEEKIDMQKEFIENIEKNGEKNIKLKNEKIKQLQDDIDLLIEDTDKKNSASAELQKQSEELGDPTKKLKQLSSLKGKLSQKASTIKEQHQFFDGNTVCPTCTQTIDEEFRLNKLSEFQDKVKEIEVGYKEIRTLIEKEEIRESEFAKIAKQINTINNEISSNNIKISQFNRQSKELECEIQEIVDGIKNTNTERKKLKKLQDELKAIGDSKSKYKEDVSYFNFVSSLLKDGGIKAKIIKKYLPLMNMQINKYLQMMDFYINFNFDEEFNEKIKSPIHEDFSYESFSEGEKMRINLAILFTWREIARMKNSVNTNLLILDEVFDSSLDGVGIEYFIKIIKYVIQDSNIFVISHKTDEMIDHFENIIKFEKVKGFSKISS
jgi:DNA repair exonuclease SbcCD ATPase subunit